MLVRLAREALRSIGQENLTSPRNSPHSELEKVVEIPDRDGRGDHAADH
jgi:hypothetical protein